MTELLAQETKNYAELAARVRQRRAGEPAWLAERRDHALERFQELGFPTPKHEDWRFTSLTPITEPEFQLAPEAAPTEAAHVGPLLYDGLGGALLVFVNGFYRSELSNVSLLPAGVTVCSLREALARHGDLVRQYYGRLAEPEKQPFTALNEALAEDGLFFHVARNVVVEQPVHAVHLSTAEAEGTLSSVRNLWIFEESSQATLLETHGTTGRHAYFKNVVTEFFAGENSNVDHYCVQRESTAASHISTTHVYQERSSMARSHTIDFGGGLVRHNLWGKLDGEGCEAIFNGLYVLAGSQHVDNFMWVEHMKENIPSHELYKGVLDDRSSAVFTGRIYVHPEAQKTDAKQTNQTLLLSDEARSTAKPQLEIYADDVKCTHGATIGQLDTTAQFYCMSRGIDRETARKLLVHAFASDIVERIRLEPVRVKVEEILTTRLEM